MGKKAKRTARGKQKVEKQEDDLESVASDITETTLDNESQAGEDEEGDYEDSSSEKFLQNLKSFIELAQEKRLSTRINGLTGLVQLLQKRCAEEEDLANQIETICDIIERSIKKGSSGSERITAAKLAAVLIITSLNCDDDMSSKIYRLLQPSLLTCCQDTTLAAPVREQMARTVAIMAYFGAAEFKDKQDSINVLHKVFSKALPKGNGELPSLSPAALMLHSAALQGFLLLLTNVETFEVVNRAPSILTEMLSVLQTKELEMRLEAGLGVALLYELISSQMEIKFKKKQELLEILSEMATDSQKYRAKKDRQKQRCLFRSIVLTLEDEKVFFDDITIKKKKAMTVVYIDNWSDKLRYECILPVLSTGITSHFSSNSGLINCFTTEEILQEVGNGNKLRKMQMEIVHKNRDLQRNKNRDMRSAQKDDYED